jgi:glutaredoxin-like YruB-family protein
MEIINIESKQDFESKIANQEKAWCLIYKKGSMQSDCAVNNLSKAIKDKEELVILGVNVGEVKDIHKDYGINTAPSLLEFEKSQFKNLVKGCQNEDFYKNLIEESLYRIEMSKNDKPQKRVTVYSTPTCSWCNTLKNHLRIHKIKYTDIDVSKDQAAAQAMVQRSGQQGVPQTDINGEMIIGFDKKRINQLLEIQG